MGNLSGGSGFGVFDSSGQLLRFDDDGYSWKVLDGLLIVSFTPRGTTAPSPEIRNVFAGSWHLQL